MYKITVLGKETFNWNIMFKTLNGEYMEMSVCNWFITNPLCEKIYDVWFYNAGIMMHKVDVEDIVNGNDNENEK